MSESDPIILFHIPNSRSSGTLVLLEELGAPYELHVLNSKLGENRDAAYLAVNPLGKVPAILHGDVLVTEQIAVSIYLADLFPAAGLAPLLDDPRRGPYLRWMAFYAGSFEPAVVDRALKREPGPQAMSPYGSFDAVMAAVTTQLRAGPFILGEQVSAADILWSGGLQWTTKFGIVPETPEIRAYIERTANRPAVRRAREKDAELAAAQTA